MEHLDFILWMVLFPIAVSICDYLEAKKREITNTIKKDNPSIGLALFWLFIGFILF